MQESTCKLRCHGILCNASKQQYGAILTSEHKKSSLAALTLAAVGIVYGDIGTSPLYTLKAVFDPTTAWR